MNQPKTYVRGDDGVIMVEVAPHQYVNITAAIAFGLYRGTANAA